MSEIDRLRMGMAATSPRAQAAVSGVRDGWSPVLRGTWQQTWRRWGRGRYLPGNAHYMAPRHVADDGPVALCGYVPHEFTQMRPLAYMLEDEAANVPPCQKCLSRKLKLDAVSSSAPVRES